jgi:hypothetical protein
MAALRAPTPREITPNAPEKGRFRARRSSRASAVQPNLEAKRDLDESRHRVIGATPVTFEWLRPIEHTLARRDWLQRRRRVMGSLGQEAVASK